MFSFLQLQVNLWHHFLSFQPKEPCSFCCCCLFFEHVHCQQIIFIFLHLIKSLFLLYSWRIFSAAIIGVRIDTSKWKMKSALQRCSEICDNLNYCLLICNVVFSNCFFCLSLIFSSLITMCLLVILTKFILFGIHWTSWICTFRSFIILGKISPMILSIFFLFQLFSSSSWTLMTWIWIILVSLSLFTKMIFFSLLFRLCNFHWSILLLSTLSDFSFLNFRYYIF